MKSLVFLLPLVLSTASNPLRQPKEIAQRRQLLGYVNNIVHENPNYPDQAAQSSVKVNFNTDQRQIYNYQQQQQQQPEQSQLFNVGYSVRFTNNNNNRPTIKQTRSNNLENAEIITGTRKQNEEVQSPQDFISSKKHKISGIKPKPQVVSSFPNPKILLTQANLSPATQKYYKALEQAKPQIANVQDLQQKYSWRNLSPGVEIIKSTEVPTVKYTRTETGFDHVKALGRSQDFDQSNAVENQQNVLYFARPQQQQQVPLVAKYQIDTSLLREQVPIQVDARFVNEEMRKLGLYANPNVNQPVQEVNYLQQAYRTIPDSSQLRPVQIVYQQQEPEQNRFQYKIYGKPQPINRQAEEPVLRQPRFLKDLYTNMRPPPFDSTYQRIVRVYK
ncbi:uncharacterized protein LOC103312520 [Tribolium castaneum]|uniref:Uncharacterized protein n=1 Tax=Tribolium castaneum TaxID=7070 RepID=D2A1R6_TRICA|nr:PREDICTED: uncharacterized protein LOC103312520 [Tribolium castaneum]EFA02116.1 hypothetical protein TcasGA2_TC007762 [Tribolium castaneum]|eukprot:XP_008191563.1 PREDICTED: uncharacterized protein LOC103312520 [Tribolium castaneum]